MTDIFTEYIVKHKLEVKDFLIMIVAVVLALFLSLAGFVIFIAVPELNLLSTILIFGSWYGAYLIIKNRSVEYEYIMTNSSLDIDKIIGKSKRKRVAAIDLKEIEICAAVDDTMHKAEFERKPEKVLDCTGNSKYSSVYFLDFSDEKGFKRILFSPTEKILKDAYKFNPRKIFINEL